MGDKPKIEYAMIDGTRTNVTLGYWADRCRSCGDKRYDHNPVKCGESFQEPSTVVTRQALGVLFEEFGNQADTESTVGDFVAWVAGAAAEYLHDAPTHPAQGGDEG